jgi:ParB family chromosome partitioning protein
MNDAFLVPLDQIDTSGRIRDAATEQVEALKDSIVAVGLINPITVCRVGARFQLVAGGNRLEACRLAGFSEILCTVRDLNEFERVIAECDENLCGSKLSPAETALFTARRKEAYEALHPETKHGGDRKSDQVDNLSTRSFAEETATATGKDERTVRRDAERGQKLIPEVLALIKGTKLDTGVYLDKLKKLPPNEQVAAAKRDLAASKRADAAEKKTAKGVEHGSTPPDDADNTPDFDPLAVRTFVAPKPDYNGLSADERIAELIDHVTALEADIRGYVAELKTYREMKVLFEKGGFEAVVAAKDELIRGMDTRNYSESEEKARWMRKASFWEKEAKRLGWKDTRPDRTPADAPTDYDDAFYAATQAEGSRH